jgi:hypothetical protein
VTEVDAAGRRLGLGSCLQHLLKSIPFLVKIQQLSIDKAQFSFQMTCNRHNAVNCRETAS